jgi:putative spermidine/putrescine transport system ATP-binding protein
MKGTSNDVMLEVNQSIPGVGGRPGDVVPAVRVNGVSMDFGTGSRAVDRASFDLGQGRFLTILGPSGSGKTTLLRMIAGFQRPTAGHILIGGKPVDAVPPDRRSIGMVFQKLALFPHMSAAENVAFPLKMRRFDPASIPGRVRRMLELVKLEGYGGRRIHELSGGQQQRIAIARALVFEPELLLLDEPLAALDRKLREEMQLEFRRIQKELGVTTINVTHDQREALVVSDEIIIMDGGLIRQHASPAVMYRSPADEFVARFIGVSSVIEGTASEGGLTREGMALAGSPSQGLRPGMPARGVVRAEQIRIARPGTPLSGCDTVLGGSVADVIFEGERLLYSIHVPGLSQPVSVFHHDPESTDVFAVDEAVSIGWHGRDMMVFEARSREG